MRLDEEREHAVEAHLHVERLEQLLLLGRLDVEEARDEVGERAGACHLLDRRRKLGRRTRRELEHLRGARFHLQHARLDVAVHRGRVGHALDARRLVRPALDELGDAKALVALDHEVVRTVRRGQVAEDRRDRPDGMKIARRRLLGLRIALQEHADRLLRARRFLGAHDRLAAAQPQRRDEPRKEHEVADRDDDERIGRQRRGLGRIERGRVRGHHATRRNASTRQPSTNSRPPIS